jgi:hypothetical protein
MNPLALALVLASGLALPCAAQVAATVTVTAGTSKGAIPAQAFGANTAVWDGLLTDSALPNLLKNAGLTMLRFPGGSTSDVYHWQTNSLTSGVSGYVNPSDTFDAFMTLANAAGATPVITVNYGSNAAGNAGGDPNEAAAWVTYANVTKNYGVKYWEIGNEIYGNGEYGADWEEDLHSSHTPTTYGQNVATFASAMKAKSSGIKIGAVLCAPGNWPDGVSPDWNSNVLSQCGTSIDFVIVHWYPQGPGGESDSGLLGDTSAISAMVSSLRSLISTYCGSNAPNVQILVTETNSVSSNPGKQSVSLVNALFTSDDYMTWLENGVTSVDFWDVHNGPNTGGNNSSSLYGSATYGDYGILSVGSSPEPAAETPFASYYGIQMLTHLGKSGDTMVSASSNQSLVAAHAVKNASGNLSLLLINKDPNNAYNVTVNLSGYTPTSSATLYNYGKTSGTIGSSNLSGIGTSFTTTIQPYSLNTVVMTPGSGSNPMFSATASASPSSVAPSGATTIQTKVTDTSGTLSNGIVDVEVYNSAGTRVSQNSWSGQNFSLNQQQTYNWSYTAPSTPGTYTIEVGVFNSTWGTNYYWNSNAATLTVTSGDSAEYNFESGTQSWTTTGGMLTGVAQSSTQVYAGSHSLAVSFNGSGTQQAYVSSPSTPAGKTVTFHVWIPSGSKITSIQPYVQQGSAGGWLWTGNYQPIGNLATNAWNTITVTVPSNAVIPLYQLGVQFSVSSSWTGTCYIDSVAW